MTLWGMAGALGHAKQALGVGPFSCSFDLGGCRTYDTRPMPDDGSKLRDVSILADEGTRLAVEVSVARMARLADALVTPEGTATASIGFTREQGFVVADVQAEAFVTLRCQRCMQPFEVCVGSDSRVWLPHSEQAAERVPAEAELMLAPEGRLRMAELVEEELLLALPLAPLHGDHERCVARNDEPLEAPEPTAEVQMPFAALGALMGRARPDEPKRPVKGRRRGD